jgi:hypothetical protein
MATIGNSFLGLADVYKATDSNRNIIPVIEALNILNPLMEDATMIECNQGTKHTSSIRTGLPQVSWGKLYQGIPQSKSTRQQVDDTTGFFEGLSTVDTRLLEITKNPAALRLSEASSFLESMAQEATTNFFYADTATTPERFKGIAARYNAIGSYGAGNQIVDGGGTGTDNMSVWFVTWGDQQTSLIYPEGTTAGVSRQDMGQQRVYDDLGNPYYVKEEQFRQHMGCRVGDWRFNSRIANISRAALLAGTVDVFSLLRQAYWKLQSRRNSRIGNNGMVSPGKTVMYANRDFLQALDGASTNSTPGAATDNHVRTVPDDVAGKEVLVYRNIPIRETDSLISAEARVVAAV